MCERLKPLSVLTNDPIVVEGEAANQIHFISSGGACLAMIAVGVWSIRLLLCVEVAVLHNGSEVCRMNVGECFGLQAVLDGSPQPVSVVAASPCELFLLPQSDANALFEVAITCCQDSTVARLVMNVAVVV